MKGDCVAFSEFFRRRYLTCRAMTLENAVSTQRRTRRSYATNMSMHTVKIAWNPAGRVPILPFIAGIGHPASSGRSAERSSNSGGVRLPDNRDSYSIRNGGACLMICEPSAIFAGTTEK